MQKIPLKIAFFLIGVYTVTAGNIILTIKFLDFRGAKNFTPGLSLVINLALVFSLFGYFLLTIPYKRKKYGAMLYFILLLLATACGIITFLTYLFHFKPGFDQFFEIVVNSNMAIILMAIYFLFTGLLLLTIKRLGNRSVVADNEEYRLFIEQATDAMYLLDFKGNFISANKSMCKITGYSSEELLKRNAKEIVAPKQLEGAPFMENCKQGKSLINESRFARKNGTEFDVEINVTVVADNRILVIARDISDKKKKETALKEAELMFRTIVEKSILGIYIIKSEKFTYVNQQFARAFGYEPEELINTFSKKIIIPENRTANSSVSTTNRITNDLASMRYQAIGTGKNGTNNWVEFYGSTAIIGDEPAIIGSMVDITAHKKAEKELKSSEQKYKLLFEGIPLPLLAVLKDDLSIIAANDAAATHYGYSKEELLNMSAQKLRPTEDLKLQSEDFKKQINGAVDLGIIRHIRKDKTTALVNVIAKDIILEGRQVRLALTRDITEKLTAEDSLKKSEANLRAILKTTNTAYALFDLDLKVLAFNPKASQYFKEQFRHAPKKGERLANYTPPDKSLLLNFADDVLHGKNVNYEIDYNQPDGSVRWFYVKLFPITNDNKEVLGVMMAVDDITSRKSAEEELTKLSFMAKHTSNVVFIKNLDGKIEWVNNAFTHITGYNSKEAIGKTEQELFADKESVPSALKAIKDKISRGKPYKYEILKYSKTGNPFWVNVQGLPMIDAKGNLNRYFVLETDISKIKNAYEKLLAGEKRIRDFAKQLNNALEDERSHIAREIHDEFGQQLTGLKMSLSTLKKNYDVPTEIIDTIIADVNTSIASLRQIANELRPILIDRLGLFAAIEWLIAEFKNKTGLDCHVHIYADQPVIDKMVAINIFRICQEALTNVAKHANASEVDIRIEKNNKHLIIKIKDNGRGLKPAVLQDKLSMGLLNMQERANMIGAELKVSSAPQMGTIVELIVNYNEKKNTNS